MGKYPASLIFSLDDVSFPARSTSQPFLHVVPPCTLHYVLYSHYCKHIRHTQQRLMRHNEMFPPLKAKSSLLSSTSPPPPANARSSSIIKPIPPPSFSRKHRTIKNTNPLHSRSPSPTRCTLRNPQYCATPRRRYSRPGVRRCCEDAGVTAHCFEEGDARVVVGVQLEV